MATELPIITRLRIRSAKVQNGSFWRSLRVLRAEPVALQEWALSLGSGLGLAALAWWLAARLYHREQLAASG